MAASSIREFGRILRKVLSSAAAWQVLDNDPALGGSTSWVAGGCLTLAAAVHEVLPQSEIVILVGTMNGHRGPQHVAVQALGKEKHPVFGQDGRVEIREEEERLLVDGDGTSTLPTFLRRWRTTERVTAPRLRAYTPADAQALQAAGILYSPEAKDQIQQMLGLALEEEIMRRVRDFEGAKNDVFPKERR